jgi:molybdopterin molybdotransferase
MISFLQAQAIIRQYAHSFGTEEVALDDALGRVLAEELKADRDYPPFNRSAMDGFAIRQKDIEEGVTSFTIVDTIYAGGTTDKELFGGGCYKIMTGASVPLSADVVIRKEDSEIVNNKVKFTIREVKPFQNIARKGEDLGSGVSIINAPVKITPSIIGLLSTIGKTKVSVTKLPTVAIITTGDEVKAGGDKVNDVEIRNSNLPVLKALFKKWQAVPSFVTHAADNIIALRGAIQQSLNYDIIVLTGGVSAGDADYVPQVLAGAGVQQLFHKTAIRPGKPAWCGHRNGRQMVFALPGNPFSCLVTYTLYIQTYLEACFGLPSQNLYLPLSVERKQRVGLDEFFPVKVEGTPNALVPVALNGSGDIRLAFEATALALHPQDVELLHKNDVLAIYPL